MDHIEIKKIRDIGTIVSDSFTYVSYYFKSLGKSILYFVVPLILVASVFAYKYTSELLKMNQHIGDPVSFELSTYFSSISGTFILGLLTSAALATVVLYHIKLVTDAEIDNNQIGVDEIWEGIKENFLMVFLLNIAVGIATGIGFVFFFIPGIFIGIKLVLVTIVYVFEEKDFIDSFSRSWDLIKNYWWPTLGLVVIMWIFIAIMAYGITLPFALLGYLAGFSGMQTPQASFSMFNQIIGSLSNVLYALMYVSLGLHYYNLVERKEGGTLEDQIDQIA